MKRKPTIPANDRAEIVRLMRELLDVLDQMDMQAEARRTWTTPPRHPLTPRQREILDLILCNEPGKRIADRLGISASTLRGHMKSAARRLGVPAHRLTLARAYANL